MVSARGAFAGGVHALTAVYKGLTSRVPWSLVVEESVHYDDFESATVGAFETIVRPHYHGVTRYTGQIGISETPTAIIYESSWSGAGKWLNITSVKIGNSNNGNFNTIYTMTFNELYAAVSFECHSVVGWGGTASARIEALAENGSQVVLRAFPPSENVFEVVHLMAPSRQFIKSLVFYTSSASSTVWHSFRVNNMRMIK